MRTPVETVAQAAAASDGQREAIGKQPARQFSDQCGKTSGSWPASVTCGRSARPAARSPADSHRQPQGRTGRGRRGPRGDPGQHLSGEDLAGFRRPARLGDPAARKTGQALMLVPGSPATRTGGEMRVQPRAFVPGSAPRLCPLAVSVPRHVGKFIGPSTPSAPSAAGRGRETNAS